MPRWCITPVRFAPDPRSCAACSRAALTAVIIGGMTTSTLLTLLFVPAIYLLLDDLVHLPRLAVSKLTRGRRARLGAVPPAEPRPAELS